MSEAVSPVATALEPDPTNLTRIGAGPMSHSSQTQPEQQALPHFYTPVPPTNTMAILSLVFAFLFWPLSIAFGHVAHLDAADCEPRPQPTG